MLSISSKKFCDKNLSSSTSAASIIGNNRDILGDILYGLPVKSLYVFKLVSKQWKSLISDQYFRRKYNIWIHRHSAPAICLKKTFIIKEIGQVIESKYETLVMDEPNSMDCVPFNSSIAVDRHSHISLKQSCNGLLLCKIHRGSNGGYDPDYVIYNPSMKHSKLLPSPPFRRPDYPRIVSVSLAYDPAKSSYYEVVGVCKTESSKDYCVKIYSSKTHSWRDAGPVSVNYALSCSGVYVNGSVHWIDEWSAVLHYFDIDCESMKKIAMPTVPMEESKRCWDILYFNECGGHVYIMEKSRDDGPCFHIWEMRKDYTGWDVKYYLDLSPLSSVLRRRRPYGYSHLLNVLLIEEGQDGPRLIICMRKKYKVISFDLKNKTFKEMYDVKPYVQVEGFQYIETLAHP